MIEKYSYGEYVIVYNGQIYNTKELKAILIDNNFTFNGHCDTEILLKSYIYYGNDVVNHLNGIFLNPYRYWQKHEFTYKCKKNNCNSIITYNLIAKGHYIS